MKRRWVNQPSTTQPYHHLHGTNVLAVWTASECTIYFLVGDTISQVIDPAALAEGWRW